MVAYFEDIAWGGRCGRRDLGGPHLESLDDVIKPHSSAMSLASQQCPKRYVAATFCVTKEDFDTRINVVDRQGYQLNIGYFEWGVQFSRLFIDCGVVPERASNIVPVLYLHHNQRDNLLMVAKINTNNSNGTMSCSPFCTSRCFADVLIKTFVKVPSTSNIEAVVFKL